jgi:hypothetical protein
VSKPTLEVGKRNCFTGTPFSATPMCRSSLLIDANNPETLISAGVQYV